MSGLTPSPRATTLLEARRERSQHSAALRGPLPFELPGIGPDTINLNYGDVAFDSPEHVKDAAIASIRDGHTHYEDVVALREAIVDKLAADNDLRVDPVRGLVTGAGAHLILFDVMQTYVGPGDEVIVPQPGSPTYLNYNTILNEGVPVYVSTRRDRRYKLDPDDVAAAITPRTKVIGLISPDNPVGAVQSREDLERIAELALRHDLLVVSDELYEKINYGMTPHFSIASLPGMAERTITINGFSKGYAMTGWRVGYAAGPPDLIEPVQAMHATNCIWLNTPAQYAAIAALRGPQEPIDEMLAEYKRRMTLLVDGVNAVDGLEALMPEGGYYLWVSTEQLGLTGEQFAKASRERARTLVGPGAAFGPDDGTYNLRLSCSAPIDELEEGLRRLQKVCTEIRDEEPSA